MYNLNSNKKRNNSVILGLKYEIKACPINNIDTNEEMDKEKIIKKKDIKKIFCSNKSEKNEQNATRYIINVNLAKKKHNHNNKIQSINDYSGVKLSISSSKKICSSFMRDNIKNMKNILQFSNRHNHNNTNK